MARMHETSSKPLPTRMPTRCADDFPESCEFRDLPDATDRRLSGDSRLPAFIVDISAFVTARLVGEFGAL